MSHEAITAEDTAPPIGAYSHAIRAGNLLFVSGQVAFDVEGNVIGKGDAEAQAKAVFDNLDRVLAAAGADKQDVTALTIFLVDIAETRAAVSKTRREWAVEPYPASSLVGVAALAHPDLLVEVEAIAVLQEGS
jgi:reactive intermediate/imine deaminase